MNIVLLGPPGAGRGTQATLLHKKYDIPKIATGDILRKEMWHESELGKKIRAPLEKGQLLPDALVNHLVDNAMQRMDLSKGFVLDGYPRNVVQADALEETLRRLKTPLQVVLLLDVDSSILMDRLQWRRVCPHGHGEWNIRLRPSPLGAQCPDCKATLVQREDDTPSSIRNRLLAFAKSIEPLKKFYAARDLVRNVSAQGTPEEIIKSIEETMGQMSAFAENRDFQLRS